MACTRRLVKHIMSVAPLYSVEDEMKTPQKAETRGRDPIQVSLRHRWAEVPVHPRPMDARLRLLTRVPDAPAGQPTKWPGSRYHTKQLTLTGDQPPWLAGRLGRLGSTCKWADRETPTLTSTPAFSLLILIVWMEWYFRFLDTAETRTLMLIALLLCLLLILMPGDARSP